MRRKITEISLSTSILLITIAIPTQAQSVRFFEERPTLTLATDPPERTFLADLTGDSVPEIIATHYAGNHVSIFKNLGQGSFSQECTYPAVRPRYAQAADLDNDGIIDLVVAEQSPPNVAIFWGTPNTAPNGCLVFSNPEKFPVGMPSLSYLRLADMNLDGLIDIVTTGNMAHQIGIHFNQGLSVAPPRIQIAPTQPIDQNSNNSVLIGNVVELLVADFDLDGDPDVIYSDGNLAPVIRTIWNETPSGSMTWSGQLGMNLGLTSAGLTIGQFATDPGGPVPALDLIGNMSLMNGIPNARVYANWGYQTLIWTDSALNNLETYYKFVPADLNGDGWDDIAFIDINNQNLETVMNTTFDGLFSINDQQTPFPLPGSQSRDLLAADMDQDGDDDLVVGQPLNQEVHVLYNQTLPSAKQPRSMSVLRGTQLTGNVTDLYVPEGNKVQIQTSMVSGFEAIFESGTQAGTKLRMTLDLQTSLSGNTLTKVWIYDWLLAKFVKASFLVVHPGTPKYEFIMPHAHRYRSSSGQIKLRVGTYSSNGPYVASLDRLWVEVEP